ncbi:MAG: Phosphate acyltransferase [Candidatus Anoxychlamydiales bacterium]|nr:Phosphate acyltransferase [Candidatus Anoxychlamydiales bacterium]
MSIKIGIDLMQSENSALDILIKIIDFAKNLKKDVDFIFFADESLKSSIVKIEKDFSFSINTKFSKNSIAMDEDPLIAIRRKKDSTIFEGLRNLKDDNIDCFISCGNTGALAAGATHILDTFKTISRPALLALLPTKKNLLAILDVGASIANLSTNLVQFALLGTAFQKTRNIKQPRVGLLNIGTEKKKGTFLHQKAYLELSKMNDYFNFIGNIFFGTLKFFQFFFDPAFGFASGNFFNFYMVFNKQLISEGAFNDIQYINIVKFPANMIALFRGKGKHPANIVDSGRLSILVLKNPNGGDKQMRVEIKIPLLHLYSF